MTENKKSTIYGIIGAVALIVIGIMIGYIINGSNRVNRSTMSKQDCRSLADEIVLAARNNKPDLIEQLNKVYSENCLNREFEQPKPQPKPQVKEQKLPETTCAAIEELLKYNLLDENDNSWEVHDNNASIYQKLADNGCEENHEKYLQLSRRESDIARALRNQTTEVKSDAPTCKQIEMLLTEKLYHVGNPDAEAHIDNAKIYANLSERGCAENSQKYKELAKKELEIARALNDDNLDDKHDSIEIVETYKRLQMQAEAERMIEKAKKLTNPAIDFIMELERIIEE